VSMVSAACPLCKIIVVEGNSATFGSLAAAEDTAVRLGAQVISNSYGARESGFTQAYATDYNHPGHVVVASSGDYGYTAAMSPANFASVTSVGGTELARVSNARGWTEKVWNNRFGASGSGCSAYVAKPSWQHDPHCPGRTIADVSALAWNVPIYDSSVPKNLGGPWLTIGGTSASSPLIAGMYALAGNAATVKPGHEYTHASALFAVTTGDNDWFNEAHGASCGYDYLCVAKKGYDAPTRAGHPGRHRRFLAERGRQERAAGRSGRTAAPPPIAVWRRPAWSTCICPLRLLTAQSTTRATGRRSLQWLRTPACRSQKPHQMEDQLSRLT